MMNIISCVFVLITLFAVGVRWLSEGSFRQQECVILAAIWAALGTLFFYNLLM